MPLGADAESIDVTTFNDVVSTGDGLTSLREAISLANDSEYGDFIYLPTGTFTLSIAGSDEDDNVTGDLDLFNSKPAARVSVTIQGDGSPVSFDQLFGQDVLFVNDQLGSSSQELTDYAVIVAADATGTITIDVDPLAGTDDVSLGGIAIGELETTFAGIVEPDSVDIIRGFGVGGDVNSLDASDDNRFSINPGFTLNNTEPPAWIEVTGTSPEANPSQLEIRLESSGNTPNLEQRVEAFNYSTGSFELVDVRNATFNSDDSVDLQITGNLADFVNDADGEMKMRVTWKPNGFVLLFPWTASVDQAVWIVNDGASGDRSNDGNGVSPNTLVNHVNVATPDVSAGSTADRLEIETNSTSDLALQPLRLGAEESAITVTDRVFETESDDLVDDIDQFVKSLRLRFDV